MEWPTIDEARKYLRKFTIINKLCFLSVINESYRLRFKYEEEECSWGTNDRHTMILRGGNFDHNCLGKLDYGNRLTNAQWVANDYEEMVRDVKIVTPTDIITRIRRTYEVNINYYTAWNAKTICVERIIGCFDEGYSIMQELCRQVLLSNPGSIGKCGCDPHTKMWTGTCITFKASLDGFVQGCRPIVGLDGCFLKGKYGGQYLAIVSLDGNNGLFPVAFYLCRSECTKTWTTFLKMLAPFLTMHPSNLTFISDRWKGLVELVSQVYFPSTKPYVLFQAHVEEFQEGI
ncbi:hypothetical protein GIB67_003346 [Kingdonia uniflora]|uniref:MULE transposase domain-containing protein n=1 Tax=Kingdonia uniflora TaxID=39325 RepID=A0A7J7P9J5_9MAGN|nr:hypothetical protein GIB67_003346 [Kingdonia uniflora]